MATLTKEQIIDREQKVFAEAATNKQDPAWWIAQDRSKRWDEFRTTFVVRPEVVAWAVAMTEKHNAVTCRYYNNTVDWVNALLICRYGEAEYHWPTNGFTDEDVKRASEWLSGNTPEGVVYL